ncbi:MAG: AAA family ATPase [bacterium]|nr:AAA family ATPase [bacterium]
MTTHAQKILGYLADLAPTGSRTTDVVQRKSEFAHLGWRPDLLTGSNTEGSRVVWRRSDLRRLASIDSLHEAEGLLRLGWLFLTGSVEIDDTTTQFCLPLLSVPVQVQSLGGIQYHLAHRGDVEMADDFFDDEARLRLENQPDPFGEGADDPDEARLANLPRLQNWVRQALSAAGLPSATLVPASFDPVTIRKQPGLKVVAGAAVYTVRDTMAPNVAGTLLGWMSQPLDDTALAELYRTDRAPGAVVAQSGESAAVDSALKRFQRKALDVFYGSPAATAGEKAAIRTPLPLNRSQREAISRTRNESITVVSGPPGTGKSHLVAAVAIAEIARGNSVLIATQSNYAAGVIADLLGRHPGPRFVRFGNRESRETVAAELGDGLAQPLLSSQYDSLTKTAAVKEQRASLLRSTISNLLTREAEFTAGLRQRDLNLTVAAQAPGVLEPAFNLEMAKGLLIRARSSSGLIGQWRGRRAEQELRRISAADPGATLDDLGFAIEAGMGESAVRRGLAGGGLALESAWAEFEDADAEWRAAIGRAVEAKRRARRNGQRRSSRAVGALASALRSGRVRRRQMLRDLSANDFLDVLPLWIGTLQDIDDTLPVAPGMFDVVIFDEASQIDQMRAAPGLARAKRAIVVGDPRQLRHVSFVSDDAMTDAAAAANLVGDEARILDVRRNSLFDAAASVSSVTWLDEHFRSVPHIIAFSDRAFYRGNLRLMTQHPRTATEDAIRTIRVSGRRNEEGVNAVEIGAVLGEVQRLAEAGVRSIGIVSPFRAQADALEEAVLEAFGPQDVVRLGLRIGTVHAFQGSEREVVIASLAIDGETAPGSLRFLQNPNLFNVMVTRAKREMVVITSVEDGLLPAGLLADYLHHAEHAPLPSEVASAPTGWVAEVDREIGTYGLPVIASYPVAGWSVDLAIGDREAAIGVECIVHPDGAETHIEQHLALRRAGWEMTDAFQSRWLTDPEGAAEMLSQKLL